MLLGAADPGPAARGYLATVQPGGTSAGLAAGIGFNPFCVNAALNAVSGAPLIAFHVVTALFRSLHALTHAASIAGVGAMSPFSSALSWLVRLPFTPTNVGAGRGPPKPPKPPRPSGLPPTAASVESKALAAGSALSAATSARIAAT